MILELSIVVTFLVIIALIASRGKKSNNPPQDGGDKGDIITDSLPPIKPE